MPAAGPSEQRVRDWRPLCSVTRVPGFFYRWNKWDSFLSLECRLLTICSVCGRHCKVSLQFKVFWQVPRTIRCWATVRSASPLISLSIVPCRHSLLFPLLTLCTITNRHCGRFAAGTRAPGRDSGEPSPLHLPPFLSIYLALSRSLSPLLSGESQASPRHPTPHA